MSHDARRRALVARAGAIFALSGLASGCQFFFPTPIDQSAEAETPSQAVHAVGPSFDEGERIDAEIFLDGVVAGKGTLKVGRRCLADGKVALPIEAEGESVGLASLFGEASSETFGLLDLDTNLPLESHWDVAMNDKRTVTELDFAPGGYRQHQTRFDGEKKPRELVRNVELPTEQTPHDGHSLLGYLRRWEPAPGTRGHLYVIMGRSLYRADVLFAGPEILNTKEGAVPAFKIDGVATKMVDKTLEPVKRTPSRPFSLWIGADEPRPPLKILIESDLAKISVELSRREVEDVPEVAPSPCEKRVDKKALGKSKGKKKPKKPGTPPPTLKFPWQL